jgi:hypothetical protein
MSDKRLRNDRPSKGCADGRRTDKGIDKGSILQSGCVGDKHGENKIQGRIADPV